MGYGNNYSSSKTSGGSSKTTSYESTKVTSPKANGYDSSKVETSSSSEVKNSKGKLGDIKRLLVRYLDICQEIENMEEDIEKLKEKRDALKAEISSHPQASTINDIISGNVKKSGTKR